VAPHAAHLPVTTLHTSAIHTSALYPVPMTVRRRLVAASARPGFAVGAGAVALVVGGLVATSTRLVLHGCVQADGAVGTTGLRLALLRPAQDCPEGTLGAGPTTLTLLSVALPVLAAYLTLALGGAGAVAAVARVARAAGRLVRPFAVRLDRPVTVVGRCPSPTGPIVVRRVGRVLVAGIARRGPPVAA
jgi:hypothetical protein